DDGDREAQPDSLEARNDVLAEIGEEPQPAKLDGDRRRTRELRRMCGCGPELPAGDDRDRHRDLRSELRCTVRARAHSAASRCEGCQRKALRSIALNTRWMTSPSAPVATARAYMTSLRP